MRFTFPRFIRDVTLLIHCFPFATSGELGLTNYKGNILLAYHKDTLNLRQKMHPTVTSVILCFTLWILI